MSVFLFLISAVLFWLGIDALMLSTYKNEMTRDQKDELMFGNEHERPVSPFMRQFSERHYPIATGSSMRLYGFIFVAAGVVIALKAWSLWS